MGFNSRELGKLRRYLWPLIVLWKLVGAILSITGRFAGVIIGVVLMVMGFFVSLTVIGAIIGVPMMIFGLLLLLRGVSGRRHRR